MPPISQLLTPLANRPFRRLFVARSLALVGSGLTTVAISLLAYDLAEGDAGVVLGTALAIKMIAYVTVAPVVGAFGERVPRRALLVGLDVARAVVVLGLLWAGSAGHVYLVILLISACSAGFTPVYQATLPDLLRDTALYTRGLALSRVTYDLEGLVSPSISGLALLFVGYPIFFALNAGAFLLSALLVGTTALPAARPSDRPADVRDNLTFGVRAYLATPRLRGLLAATCAVALAGAMVIVNSVVIVRDRFGGSEAEVALAFAASGAGSLLAALATPALLGHLSLRACVAGGALLLPLAIGAAALAPTLPALLLGWALAGAGMSLVQTPAGRVLEASCNPADRAAYFAAHFSLSHAAWLVGYPLAGLVGARLGLDAAFVVAAVGAGVAGLVGLRLWPGDDPEELWHEHPTLAHSHPHVHDAHHEHGHDAGAEAEEEAQEEAPHRHAHAHAHRPLAHRHRFVIDVHHPRWPRRS